MSANSSGQNGSSSNHHVNSNRKQLTSTDASSRAPGQSANGHPLDIPPHSAMNSTKNSIDSQKATSPHKLMIGVPPAPTPRSADVNGSANGQQPQPAQSNGVAKGKERELRSISDIPLSQLEQELPLEDADLVPLAALVERLSNHGYEALQNLTETLSSLPSSSKRAKIFSTALDVRKQFIKLLVLSRWSTDVADLQKARNIISLLSEQQWQHEDVFAGLTDVRKILPNARMRDADLPTAIDVLRTGTYRRLPTSIKDMAVAQTPFSDKGALAVVARLEDALRTRMLCHEVIPAALSNYTIHDGKVHFRVDGLFDAQLTASGDGSRSRANNESAPPEAFEADRWWLLDLRFDAAASGSGAESANKLFPRKPKQAYRERLRIWGDQELAPRKSVDGLPQPSAPSPSRTQQADADVEMQDIAKVEDDADKAEGGEESQAVDLGQRDVPLLRLFAFLQERSLHYQLDILQHQAYELCRLNWGSNLRIETRERPRSLVLHYWARAQSSASSSSTSGGGPAAGGSISISLIDLEQHQGFEKVVTHLLDDTDSETQEGTEPESVKRRGLKVTWNADPTILDHAGTFDMSVSPQSLDVEQIVSEVVRRHSSALLRHLQKQILVGEHQLAGLLRPEDCTLCTEASLRQSDDTSASDSTGLEYLRIDLQAGGRQRLRQKWRTIPPLRLHVDHISGRILLEAEGNLANESSGAVPGHLSSFTASTLTARPNLAPLAEATERLNTSITSLFDVLRRLEIHARVGEWERKVSHIGLRSVRKLNFRPQELGKFGPSVAINGPPVLFIPLGSSFPGYFLALQPSELVGVSIALICVAETVDAAGTASLTLQSIEWLDRVKIATASPQSSDAPNRLGKRSLSTKTDEAATVTVAGIAETEQQDGRGELTMQELSSIHSYSVALVSYFRVEQQLRMRSIPYLHISTTDAPPADKRRRLLATDEGAADTEASASNDTGVEKLVPTLCLRASDLLGVNKAHLCKPSVALRVCDWEDISKMRVEISVRLRMKSRRFQSLKTVFARNTDSRPGDGQSWVEFDAHTAVLVFSTKQLDDCIATFQLHWEKIARMAELAREVLNVSRAWQQQALLQKQKAKKPEGTIELQRFTFQDVVFAYGRALTDSGEAVQLLVRVRWQDPKFEMSAFGAVSTSHSGGFVVGFGSIPAESAVSASFYAPTDASGTETGDPAGKWFTGDHVSPNPHNAMAFELRRTINAASQRQGRAIWKGFFQLLTNTLPLIRELEPLVEQALVDANTPELELRGATWFRLRFLDRYALDLRLTSQSRLLVCDASQPLFRSPVKGLAPASTDGEEGVFTGSRLLDALATGDRETAATGTTYSAGWVTEQSTHQFQPIPNFDRVLRDTAALVPSAEGSARKVWDLRRALLVSLAQEDNASAAASAADLLHTLLPALIAKIQAEIGAS